VKGKQNDPEPPKLPMNGKAFPKGGEVHQETVDREPWSVEGVGGGGSFGLGGNGRRREFGGKSGRRGVKWEIDNTSMGGGGPPSRPSCPGKWGRPAHWEKGLEK